MFCLFFCLDAKETKNQGQPDPLRAFVRPTHWNSTLNSKFSIIGGSVYSTLNQAVVCGRGNIAIHKVRQA
jgi:hypothetical protein